MNFRQFFCAAILAIFSVNLACALANDSIKIQHEDGVILVLHQVEAKETLFSLSQRYGAAIDAIVEINQISDSNLSVGTILKIPWSHGISHQVEPGQTLYALSKLYQVPVDTIKKLNGISGNEVEAGSTLLIVKSPQVESKVSGDTADFDYHIVASEETLYGISRQYDLELDKLKDWNQISGNEVRIGDTLLIRQPQKKPVTTVTNKVAKPVKVAKSGEAKPVQERGIAAVIDGSTDTRKYLALHPTAPYGTIMKVRNELTNLSVFVRVVGALPATGANNNILIRLSPAAQEALGALDNKFRVELSYVSP